jgi:hypothetical protein
MPGVRRHDELTGARRAPYETFVIFASFVVRYMFLLRLRGQFIGCFGLFSRQVAKNAK